MFERCRETFACFLHTPDPRGTFEVTPEEREAFFEKLYAERGFGIWQGNFRDILTDRAANAAVSDFVARKIRQRVKDQAVAEKLIPKNHGFGTRRVPLETKYYEVYNQPNVRLVDIKETPIERITPKGIKTSDAEYEFDIIIYATGFDAITGSFDRIDIRGVDGRKLKDKWKGGPQTYPRRAGRGLPQHVHADGPAHRAGQHPAQHRIQRRLGDRPDPPHARARSHAAPTRRPEGVAAWTDHVKSLGEGLLSNEVNSWMTGINTQRRRQADPHHRPLQRQRAGLPGALRRGGGEWVSGAGAGVDESMRLPQDLTLRSARSARLEGWATPRLVPTLRDAVLRTAPQGEV